MLSLPEQILLLATDDETGNDSLRGALNRALIAAALLDLLLQGRIVRREPGAYQGEPKTPAVVYPFWHQMGTYHLADGATKTGNGYLDHVLGTLAAHPRSDRLHGFSTLALTYLNRTNLMSPIINSDPPNQRTLAAQGLIAREALVSQESLFLGMRVGIRLPQGNRDTGEAQLRCDLQAVISDAGFRTDERFRALLLIIHALSLIENVWGREKRDVADWRILQTLRLTAEPLSVLADVRRYILFGIEEGGSLPLQITVPIPR